MNDIRETIHEYVAESAAFERHVERALAAQIDRHEDVPAITRRLTDIRDTVASHADELEQLLERRDASTSPVKRATTTVLGLGAGLVDRFRDEGLPRNLRDDYVAAGMGAVSYVMLHTTALALGDDQVADIARRNLKDYARITMEIHNLMPATVLRFLAEEGHPVDESRLPEIAQTLDEVWRTTAQEVPEPDEIRV